MNTIKKSLLVLTGAATLAVAGTASAMSPPYAMCNYKGSTTLTLGTTSITCWTTLTAKVDCDGNVEVAAVGAAPGDPSCRGLYTGNVFWTADAADIIAGGSINTDPDSLGLAAVINAAGTALAGGTLSGVGPTGSISVACDDNGGTVSVPTLVPVNGTFSSTGAAFVANPGLENKGCTLDP